MNDSLSYIDQFFKGSMNAEELKAFEKRIKEDPAFAEELSFYISSVQVLRDEVAEEKKERFRAIWRKKKQSSVAIFKYAAAAALLAIVATAIFLLIPSPSPEKIAGKYIDNNLMTLGVLMGNRQDSMQRAIQLYNDGKLEEARVKFEQLIANDSSDHKAREYAGIVYLRMENFDKALEHFKILAGNTRLYANPGNFYISLTLLKRNAAGDVEQAKTLLQQIVKNGDMNRNAAQKMLKQL